MKKKKLPKLISPFDLNDEGHLICCECGDPLEKCAYWKECWVCKEPIENEKPKLKLIQGGKDLK